jgi:hypothetical protein
MRWVEHRDNIGNAGGAELIAEQGGGEWPRGNLLDDEGRELAGEIGVGGLGGLCLFCAAVTSFEVNFLNHYDCRPIKKFDHRRAPLLALPFGR